MHVLEDDRVLIPISALEHYSYCPRQCALIHMEQTYDENLYTLRGNRAHERAHTAAGEQRRGVTVRRGMALRSARLGLTGKADVVEFQDGVPYPVEYKVGPRHAGGHAELQLCAQALCLEEMCGVAVPEGAIFSHATRERYVIALDAALRARTEEAVIALRAMLVARTLPPAPNDARCRGCSLIDSCLPGAVAGGLAARYYDRRLFAATDDTLVDAPDAD